MISVSVRRSRSPRLSFPLEFTSEEISISRRLFLLGFLCLPFLWLVNWIKFRKILKPIIDFHGIAEKIGGSAANFERENFDFAAVPPSLASSVKNSRTLFILSLALWLAWVAAFYSSLGSNWSNSLRLFDPDSEDRQ